MYETKPIFQTRSKWGYYLENPSGGGMNSYPSQKAAISQGILKKDFGNKKKIWMVIEKWNMIA